MQKPQHILKFWISTKISKIVANSNITWNLNFLLIEDEMLLNFCVDIVKFICTLSLLVEFKIPAACNTIRASLIYIYIFTFIFFLQKLQLFTKTSAYYIPEILDKVRIYLDINFCILMYFRLMIYWYMVLVYVFFVTPNIHNRGYKLMIGLFYKNSF